MARSIPPVIGISPFETPDVGLVVGLARAGALGVVDLGHDPGAARQALDLLTQRGGGASFGVRFPEHLDPRGIELPQAAEVVVVPAASRLFSWGPRTVLAQVSTLDEARAAIAAGVDGLVVKGNEAGGVVSDETSFVLLQRVLSEVRMPVWAQGGIGLHSGAACVAAGARGVVLDSQLALVEEASTSDALRRALLAMDGTETIVAGGYRVYARADARKPDAGADGAAIAGMLGARDPAEHLVALGQDGCFARRFAERFGSVGRLVRAFETAFEGHARQARSTRPLARHAPLAHDLGTEFPIVQGPMTRVSDRAAFAEAVAKAGGLPFLALSLMRGAEARTLLEETRARLGDRPWGVGILGFVPAELRDEQLALLTEQRPPFALVAGGRPSQIEPLEAAGIRSFLHVPSPALLEMFLKEGARRFVFEGGECGGHVGPRSSFVLWEGAIEKLLLRERLADVSVLFAGGVHDGLSARMVATLAAPLAARGAKVGVLMGTAYLFTEEAVASGAIGTAFQEAAMRCDRTALLETAPGHKTRCAVNDYVRTFEGERRRLGQEGADPQATWAELERLNLGRLRIASKGLRRDGANLAAVGEDEQRREGMFMIGQVAALRSERLTMAELHRDVSDGSIAERADVTTRPASRAIDIAIVGMACIYPDAPDKASFWSNVVLGQSAIREVSPERWDPARYFDPKGTGDKTPSKWGGFVPPTLFDPAAYGIPPRSLAAIDPVQILSLEIARRALDDAGYANRPFDRERASVVFGAEAGADLSTAYAFRAALPQYFDSMPAELDAALPKLTEDSFPGVLSNVIAGRIANRLDLRGVNYTVDAACASSLAAVDVACKELASGASDMVLAGGADLHNGIYDYLMFASVHALSPTGQCRPFDARADGIALGEGVAAVVLKRLADAERDGDRIYAVLKGIGGSSDGKSLGLTAPRKEGQLRALERAYTNAGISPVDVGLVEAHGTGTVVGDRTELATLTEFFEASGAERRSCTLGSVKAQIGHTKCAAGMAGLIKATLAVHTGVLPPTNNVEQPNPGYDSGASPFVLRQAATPWVRPDRVAAVSAFGFGGTNFHAVLASHPTTSEPTALEAWPAELFVLRAADDGALARVLDFLDRATRAEVPPRLRDLAASAHRWNAGEPVRVAMVATSLAELAVQVAAVRDGRAARGVHLVQPIEGDVAFLFPGQGSQRPGMLAELFVAFPALRALLSLGTSWTDRIFPGGAFTPEERAAQKQAVADTRVAQPALGMADLGTARLLESLGVKPAMVAGHSYGELVALAFAGAFDARTLLALSEARARCILAAAGDAPGTMAAVRGSEERVRALLAEHPAIVLANHNAPEQVVISGPNADVERACQTLADAGLAARAIPVACAFHSPVVADARDTFAAHLETVEIGPMALPVYANATAAPYGGGADDVRRGLAAQVALPVRFVEEVEAMYRAGARVFVEAGPGGVLSDLVGRILGDRSHVAIACEAGGATGIGAFLSAVARLIGAGVEVDPGPLFVGRATARTADELAKQFEAPSTAWMVDGGGARPLRGELPSFAMRPLTKPISLTEPRSEQVTGRERALDGERAPGGEREAVVRDYLQSMREVVEQQRQVMLAYLGAGGAATITPGATTLESPTPSGVPQGLRRGMPSKAATPPPVPVPERAAPTVDPAADGPAPTALEALISIVTERTGYPAHMLDPNVDLEADLGIDSIKRIEIVGALRDKLRLAVHSEAMKGIVDELAAAKTLRTMAELIETRLQRSHGANGASATNGAAHPPATLDWVASSNGAARSDAAAAPICRYVVEVTPVAPSMPGSASLRGKAFAITRDALGVAPLLAELLERRGAETRVLEPGERLGQIDALVHLETLAAGAPAVRSLFSLAKEAAQTAAVQIVAVTGLGGRFGHGARAEASAAAGGVSGLLKSLAKERPALRVRVVDFDPAAPANVIAERVFHEIVASDAHVEIGYVDGQRHTLVAAARSGSLAREEPVQVDENSVILVTGGARGITGRIGLAMARRFRCTLELVGRSPNPIADEDLELRGAIDAPALRRILAARSDHGTRATLAAVDRECRQILAGREIRATLGAIRDAGAKASYHAVDVRDDAAFGALVDRLRARHGRIDGVVHGAGLIEDKLLCDKTTDSFDRVFSTKVAGANLLAEKLAHDARFFVLFSSIAGTFGSRGQTDYAAANDALDKLAHRLHHTVPGRVLSIGWGPWRGVGMVHAELEREYDRRGIALIAPDAGVDLFFRELLSGSDPQVLLTAAPAEVLA